MKKKHELIGAFDFTNLAEQQSMKKKKKKNRSRIPPDTM